MAKVSRKALQQIYDTLGEILNGAAAQDDAANKLDREDNDKARAQDSPRIGGMDNARTMRKLVPDTTAFATGPAAEARRLTTGCARAAGPLGATGTRFREVE